MLPQSSRMMKNLLVRAVLAEVLPGQSAKAFIVGAALAGQVYATCRYPPSERVIPRRRNLRAASRDRCPRRPGGSSSHTRPGTREARESTRLPGPSGIRCCRRWRRCQHIVAVAVGWPLPAGSSSRISGRRVNPNCVHRRPLLLVLVARCGTRRRGPGAAKFRPRRHRWAAT